MVVVARRRLTPGLGIVLAALLVASCSTAPKVERVDVDEVTDLSGQWNDTDSRLVSDEMVQDALGGIWADRFRRSERRPPVVIVGEVRNLSHEHINTQTFVRDIERALINSGEVEFVASRPERGEVREERKDQDINAREDTRKPAGLEIGADFMLKGSINTIFDAISGKQAKFYQVDLTLISLTDNRKVWVGQKKIKKIVTHSGIRP
ncbi:MAG: penicillin-binding protein activator LpoB [Chromatiales bacterium]